MSDTTEIDKDSNVIEGTFRTFLPLSPERVLDAAKKRGLKLCIILGVDEQGDFFIASSDSDKAMVLWQMERGKQWLFNLDKRP